MVVDCKCGHRFLFLLCSPHYNMTLQLLASRGRVFSPPPLEPGLAPGHSLFNSLRRKRYFAKSEAKLLIGLAASAFGLLDKCCTETVI